MAVVYITPGRSRDVGVMEAHVASIRELRNKADSVLACGDVDHVVSISETSSLNAAGVALLDEMDFVNLSQRNTIMNELPRTLDLVFYK